MQIIDTNLLDKVTEQAALNQRLRMNYNFHESMDAKSQRLLNALEPGTLLPIHRHRHTDETYVLLRGAIRVLFYNDKKILEKSIVLSVENENFGVNIPAGQWHTLEVLAKGTVIFEVKDGPYFPLTEEDILEAV